MIKEITPLTQNDCFTIFSRVKQSFDFPMHFHEEYELNLILNGEGAKRNIGDHIEEIGEMELVLVGPNLPHAWINHQCKSDIITEVTIQWHQDLFSERMLRRNQIAFIKRMFDRSVRGILFPRETIEKLYTRILSINQLQGFNSVLELMSILHELSKSKSMRTLSDGTINNEKILNYNSRRIDKAYEYIKDNFHKSISLKDMAELVSMAEVSFSRLMKKRTGTSFIESLNEIRLGHATRMLIETTHSVKEISQSCGFNNISNFNRMFKKKKHCTPKAFREEFSGSRIFI